MVAVGEVNLWAPLGCEEAFGKGGRLSLAAACPWCQQPGPRTAVFVSGNVLLPLEMQRGSKVSCGRWHRVLCSHRNIKYILKHSFGVEAG